MTHCSQLRFSFCTVFVSQWEKSKMKKNIIVWGNSEDKANSFVLKKLNKKKLASVFGSFPDGEVVPFFSRYVLGLSDTLYISPFAIDDKYRQKARNDKH